MQDADKTIVNVQKNLSVIPIVLRFWNKSIFAIGLYG